MNSDIKEILEEIKSYENKEVCVIVLSQEENKALIDYITNLQEENEHLRTQVNTYKNVKDKAIEKKIPEKITINDNGTIGFPNGKWTARNMDKAFAIKFNQLIEYIESKGE